MFPANRCRGDTHTHKKKPKRGGRRRAQFTRGSGPASPSLRPTRSHSVQPESAPLLLQRGEKKTPSKRSVAFGSVHPHNPPPRADAQAQTTLSSPRGRTGNATLSREIRAAFAMATPRTFDA
ncbi:hypothetical protein chiPu_0029849 [Chiloscyllium punctatum]|uniref:Uncharacterized protein n=1 Tax=Chiloscyllium punctatum TaxID=137246 RepID=A0A401TS61_CHIPU|nr:hypothetical protein [Chiloscyllium punctatum]